MRGRMGIGLALRVKAALLGTSSELILGVVPVFIAHRMYVPVEEIALPALLTQFPGILVTLILTGFENQHNVRWIEPLIVCLTPIVQSAFFGWLWYLFLKRRVGRTGASPGSKEF